MSKNILIEQARLRGFNKADAEDLVLFMQERGISDLDEGIEIYNNHRKNDNRVIGGFHFFVTMIIGFFVFIFTKIFYESFFGTEHRVYIFLTELLVFVLLGLYFERRQPFKPYKQDKEKGVARGIIMFLLIGIAVILFLLLVGIFLNSSLPSGIIKVLSHPLVAIKGFVDWLEYSFIPIVIIILGFGIPLLGYLGLKKIFTGTGKI